MKPVRLTKHAREQAVERGATEAEVVETVRHGTREPAKLGREFCRYNFAFGQKWNGNHYAIKQVAPVIKEAANEIVVLPSIRSILKKIRYENQLRFRN